MYIYLNVIFILSVIASIVILIFAIKSKYTLKTLFFNSFLGISVLLILNLTKHLIQIEIYINPMTVISGAVFGIPGVLGTLLSYFII